MKAFPNNKFLKRKKSCPFSGPQPLVLDYTDAKMLRSFINNNGKITPPRVTGVTAKYHRKVAKAVKQARVLGLLPYVGS